MERKQKPLLEPRRVAVAGFGNVGKGIIEVLLKEQVPELKLVRIAVRDPKKIRPFNVDPNLITTDLKQVARDPEVDIVVEVMGGVKDAASLVFGALHNGKDVVTANKTLLAQHGHEIFDLALQLNRYLGFRGTFVGCNALIHDVSLSAKRIRKVYAILNATCNYILSNMAHTEVSLEKSLEEAQAKGYAEADPSEDIDGIDTAHKIQILSAIISNSYNTPSDFPCEGIRDITAQDIKYAKELGYVIKLLGIIERGNGKTIICVHPALVRQGTMLASVEGADNGIELENEFGLTSGLVAPGAGTYPTTMAIINDLLDIAYSARPLMPSSNIPVILGDIKDTWKRYYIRLTVTDQAGVLAQITKILGEYNISLAAVIQKESISAETVSVVMTTHRAKEENLQAAIKKVDELDVVKAKTRIIRIIDR